MYTHTHTHTHTHIFIYLPILYVNFKMFQLVLEKAEEPEIKLSTSAGSSEKGRVPEEHLFLP